MFEMYGRPRTGAQLVRAARCALHDLFSDSRHTHLPLRVSQIMQYQPPAAPTLMLRPAGRTFRRPRSIPVDTLIGDLAMKPRVWNAPPWTARAIVGLPRGD